MNRLTKRSNIIARVQGAEVRNINGHLILFRHNMTIDPFVSIENNDIYGLVQLI